MREALAEPIHCVGSWGSTGGFGDRAKTRERSKRSRGRGRRESGTGAEGSGLPSQETETFPIHSFPQPPFRPGFRSDTPPFPLQNPQIAQAPRSVWLRTAVSHALQPPAMHSCSGCADKSLTPISDQSHYFTMPGRRNKASSGQHVLPERQPPLFQRQSREPRA